MAEYPAGMVVAAQPEAVEAGAEVLRNGAVSYTHLRAHET